MGETVISSGDPAEVLDPSKHALDGVTLAVERGREAVFPAPADLRWNVRGGAHALDLVADRIAVVALVAMQDVGGVQLIEQGVSGDAIRDLAARQEERDRAAEFVGERVDFRRSAATGAANRLAELPPFPPEAQR